MLITYPSCFVISLAMEANLDVEYVLPDIKEKSQKLKYLSEIGFFSLSITSNLWL